MKQLLIPTFVLLGLASCGGGDAEPNAGGGESDPLDTVPTAEEAAQEADSINEENAEEALDALEAELNAESDG